ncbi:unnamed protein product [Closterium sp. NIES-54]
MAPEHSLPCLKQRRSAAALALAAALCLAALLVSPIVAVATAQPLHPTQVKVLQDYQAAWGKTIAGWSGTNPICGTASGLMCDGNGMITTIELGSNQLSGSIPASITALRELTFLAFNNVASVFSASNQFEPHALDGCEPENRLRWDVISCHVMSCHVMSCHVMSCHVMSCHVMSCLVMSVMSCHLFLPWSPRLHTSLSSPMHADCSYSFIFHILPLTPLTPLTKPFPFQLRQPRQAAVSVSRCSLILIPSTFRSSPFYSLLLSSSLFSSLLLSHIPFFSRHLSSILFPLLPPCLWIFSSPACNLCSSAECLPPISPSLLSSLVSPTMSIPLPFISLPSKSLDSNQLTGAMPTAIALLTNLTTL